MLLFDRRWSLTIGNVRITDLRVQFRAVRSLKPEPNTLDLAVYNLSEARRQAFDTTSRCYLEAGYKERVAGIFLGDVRSVSSVVDGQDIITKLASGDGEKAIRGARVAVHFGPQVTAGQVLDELVKALGLSPGNAAKAKATLSQLGVTTIYPKGVSLYGNAYRELQEFARSAGVEISVQDGAIQVLDTGQALGSRAVLLSPSTGLIGSPTVDADGTVAFQALMIPDLKPGVRVQLDSIGVKGFFRLTHCEYKGDTKEDAKDWGVACHAQRLKGL